LKIGKTGSESGIVLFYAIEIKRKIDEEISDSHGLVKLKAIWQWFFLRKIGNKNEACHESKDDITYCNL